jgi:hypothetical protein
MILAALLLLHGDDPHMELIYFFSALLLALLPMGAFTVMCVWVFRKYRQEQAEDKAPPRS